MKALKARIARLERSTRVGNTTVERGALRVIEPADKQVTAWIGQASDPVLTRPDGEPQSGSWWYRDDIPDSPAFAIVDFSPDDGPYRQTWNFTDRRGNVVLREDQSGFGLGKPWLPQGPWFTPDVTCWPETSSGSWQAAWWSLVTVQQPVLWVQCVGQADAGTAGEVRILFGRMDDGDVVAASGVIPSGGYSDWVTAEIDLTGYPYGWPYYVQIQYRKTSGPAGEDPQNPTAVRAAVSGSYQRQS